MGKYIQEALKVTTGERRRDYDRPLPNFLRIALLQNVWDAGRRMPGDYITPLDTDMKNILQKIAREQNTHKDDNPVDIIGYADLIDDMQIHLGELGYPPDIMVLADMDVGEMFELLLKSGPNGKIYQEYFDSKLEKVNPNGTKKTQSGL